MLARMLRYLLLGQILAGSLLGWWLARLTGFSTAWVVPVVALLLPVLTMRLGVFTSALLSRIPGHPALWWRSVVGEIWITAKVMFFKMPWTTSPPTLQMPLATPERIPVLLVHGFVCNYRIWDAMANELGRAGHPILGLNLEPVFGSIDGYIPLIEDAVESLRHQTGAQQIAVVAHSMGGLATRAWMREHGTARVARVLTLGTPHVGTRLATWSHAANGRQMRWHSPWLQELARGEPAANLQLIRIALTPQDNIVYPQREQVLPGVPVTVFEGRGHIQLCFDKAVIKWVLQQFEGLPGNSPEPTTGTLNRSTHVTH